MAIAGLLMVGLVIDVIDAGPFSVIPHSLLLTSLLSTKQFPW